MSLSPNPARVLCRAVVVDDHVDSADMLVELLTLRGVDASAAYDGAEALEIIQRVMPALVLVDLGLPRIDGYEIARRIRLAERAPAMKLVAVTGRTDAESRARALSAGFDDLLVKPVDIQVVMQLAERSFVA